MKVILVTSVLLISIALPFVPFNGIRVLLLVFFPLIAMALVFLRWPPLGLVLLILGGFLISFEIKTGAQTAHINVTMLLLAFLIGLWLFDMIALQRQIRFYSSRAFIPLIGLMVAAVIGFFVGQLPWFAFASQRAPLTAQLGGLALFFLSAGAFILVAHRVKDLRWLEWMTWTFVFLGALFIARLLLNRVLGFQIIELFQVDATASSSMFWTWLVALSFSQAVINKKLPFGWRLALGCVTVATLYVGLFWNFGWVAGYIPPLIAVAAIIGLRSKRILLPMLLAAAVVVWFLIMENIATEEGDYSYSTRLDAWLIMLEIIKFSPIFGFGPANYYWYTPLYRIRGWYVPFNSHSQYVDIVAQTGLLGLAFFLWFFFEVGRLGWQLRSRVPEGFARAYVYGALGGLAGTLAAAALVDWVIPFVYNIGFKGFRGSILAWIFLAGLVCLDQIFDLQKSN